MIGAGGTSGARYIEITDGNAAPVSDAGGARIRVTAAGEAQISQNGSAYVAFSSLGLTNGQSYALGQGVYL